MLYTLIIIYLWIIKIDLIVGNESSQSYGCYPSVLYVWSGQDTSVENAADFVAVIDFDETSPTYGQIIKRVSLVSNPNNGIGQTGNEPHHSGISSDGKYYLTGGLLSFLSQNKEVFVWRIPNNPRNGPQFLYALDVPGACTDEFLPIGNAKFLVSMMCNENAVSPGDMVLIDAKTGSAESILQNASSLIDFNPHGFGRLDNGSIFVADYIQPLSLTGNDVSQIVFRNTTRHFLPNGKLERIFQFTYPTTPGSTTGIGTGIGFMELKSIPNDPYGRSYACGTNLNVMFLIGPGMPEPILVFDASVVNGFRKRASSGITSIFPDGKRLLMTFQMRYVIMLNITNPVHPTILRVFDFCSDPALNDVYIQPPGSSQNLTFAQYCSGNNNITGSHVLIHPIGESRFIVLNYFLHFGLAQFAGTRTVHAFKLNEQLTDFQYDKRFNPNFQFNVQNETFHSLKAFPHHAQYIRLKTK
jgi:selenium-binding protein 1